MLDGLTEIDWQSLGEPNIPKWLVDFTSHDREVGRAAFWTLEDRLTPDLAFDDALGNIDYFKHALRDDVPLTIVPFLIEILTEDKAHDRGSILELLHNLACYLFAAAVYTSPDNAEDQIYRTRARLIQEAVRKGTPIYQSFLDLPESNIDSEEMQIKQGAKDILRILEIDNINGL